MSAIPLSSYSMLTTFEAVNSSTDDCVHVYFLKQQAKGNIKPQY